ncbi:MAG: hypothetical protein ACM3IJ_02825 [Candidatus Levyibacteriota bacterium]
MRSRKEAGQRLEALGTELAATTFKPGNLVWGTREGFESLPSLVEMGIVAPVAIGVKTLSRDVICTAILSKRKDSYKSVTHRGPYPGTSSTSRSLGIVISREKALERFPGEVYAVGHTFKSVGLKGAMEDAQSLYDISRDGKVFGIPIDVSHPVVYNEEVRFFPRDPKIFAITPDMWEGVVMGLEMFNYFSRAGGVKRTLPIPIFTPDMNLLSPEFNFPIAKSA